MMMTQEGDNIRIDTVATLSGCEQLDLSGRLENPHARARLISANGAFVKSIAAGYTGRGIHQPMAHRVDRINELWELYCDLPNKTEHVTRGTNKGGGEWESTKIENNHLRKAQLLKQIADEAEEGKIDEVAELRKQLAELKGGPQLEVAGTAEGVFAIKYHTGV